MLGASNIVIDKAQTLSSTNSQANGSSKKYFNAMWQIQCQMYTQGIRRVSQRGTLVEVGSRHRSFPGGSGALTKLQSVLTRSKGRRMKILGKKEIMSNGLQA